MVGRFGEDELIQLTDTSGSNAVDATKVEQAIDDASSMIDGYLQGRYDLPLANPPAVLTKLCADIARYNLYDNGVTELIQTRFDAAMKFLKSVSSGEVQLGLAIDDSTTESDSLIEMQSSESVFSRTNASGFI